MKNQWIAQWITMSTLMISISCTAGEGKGGEGHGGIDFLLPDGSYMPHGLYLATRAKPLESICEINNGLPKNADIEWRKRLNRAVAALYAKLPVAGFQLAEALTATRFFWLMLDPQVKIQDTADAGGFLHYSPTNGAIRVRDKVYLLDTVWKSYWKSRKNDSDFDRMLVRTLHEALLKYYEKPLKNELDEAVLAILKLASELKSASIETELSAMSAEQVIAYLKDQGLTPDTESGDLAKTLNSAFEKAKLPISVVKDGYALAAVLSGEKIAQAEWKRSTYSSSSFQSLALARDSTAQAWKKALRNTPTIQWATDGTLEFTSLSDVKTFQTLLKEIPPFVYVTRFVPEWPTEVIEQYKINTALLEKIEVMLRQAPLVCGGRK